MKTKKNILGIDIGGVIISKANDRTDTSFFSDNFLQTTQEEGAFDAIKRLVYRFDEVYIVSKCGNKVREKTKKWLEHQDFYNKTGVLKENVYYCYERHEKAPICKSLGVTHFIDDRIDVLEHLNGIVEKRIQFFNWEDAEQKLCNKLWKKT